MQASFQCCCSEVPSEGQNAQGYIWKPTGDQAGSGRKRPRQNSKMSQQVDRMYQQVREKGSKQL